MDQKAVKVDGHYELPLPVKDEDIRLPKSKKMIDSSKNTRILWKN